MDVMASEGSAGENTDAEKVRYYERKPYAFKSCQCCRKINIKGGKVVEGTVASANSGIMKLTE